MWGCWVFGFYGLLAPSPCKSPRELRLLTKTHHIALKRFINNQAVPGYFEPFPMAGEERRRLEESRITEQETGIGLRACRVYRV